jgi:hypothetical protein
VKKTDRFATGELKYRETVAGYKVVLGLGPVEGRVGGVAVALALFIQYSCSWRATIFCGIEGAAARNAGFGGQHEACWEWAYVNGNLPQTRPHCEVWVLGPQFLHLASGAGYFSLVGRSAEPQPPLP